MSQSQNELRDAAADLAVCNAASPGPWKDDSEHGDGLVTGWNEGLRIADCGWDAGDEEASANCTFIALARTALPHWINRAVTAEAEIARLNVVLDGEREMCKGDGTNQLLTIMYGESSAKTIGKAIGGSCAPMLFDAAREIVRLRGILGSVMSVVDRREQQLGALESRIDSAIRAVDEILPSMPDDDSEAT